ncbi:uncharacterized protein [Primulina huaijiensis]|uniref:uncharacterized protein n=1 Tax=Primulina huaijiensis TaxID=1492673 RepID=UPI003CC6E47A
MMHPHIDHIVPNEKKLQHFSHNHPLIYVEDQENPKACCSACGVAIISSPSYGCSRDCDFFLHQPCTELLQSSDRDFGGFCYNLEILTKPPHGNCNCEKCGNVCKNFTYKCSGMTTFYLHCQCAFPLEINIKHISHREHSLTAMCNESTLVCNACGKERKGIFFSCSKCSFYIHQDCCLLPSIINTKDHNHHLTLLYSLSSFIFESPNCLICGYEVSLTLGAYICGWCERAAHIHCVASEMDNLEIVKASFRLPWAPDTFPNLIIRTFLKNTEDAEIEDVKSKIEKYHTDHSSWIYHHQDQNDIQLVCNACTQPIIPSTASCYSCSEQQCSFLLHQPCANLLPTIKDYFWNRPRELFSKSSGICSVFECSMCGKKSNGFGYKDEYSLINIDVECVASPHAIKHESHSQHLLALSIPWYPRKTFLCCDVYYSLAAYSCRLCDHHIHAQCAFLPKTVMHKFDKHPLTLIYDPAVQIPQEENKENDYLCEFCEQDIDAKFWFYYCDKCDQSFHINCIPSTGKLSKIKFGYNIDLPRHVHDHPVTLTRMLTMGSQRCGFCKRTIQGFVDHMAFHCSMCDFWIHFECT